MDKVSNTIISVAEVVGDYNDVYCKDDDSEHGNPSQDQYVYHFDLKPQSRSNLIIHWFLGCQR